MNNFQSFGKMLTRDEQRKIRGGDDPSDTIEGDISLGCSQQLDFCGRSTGGYDVYCCKDDGTKCVDNVCVK
jgi:hypothetical protein